jgi:hypothetical protein
LQRPAGNFFFDIADKNGQIFQAELSLKINEKIQTFSFEGDLIGDLAIFLGWHLHRNAHFSWWRKFLKENL